jgi:hypothetical protein
MTSEQIVQDDFGDWYLLDRDNGPVDRSRAYVLAIAEPAALTRIMPRRPRRRPPSHLRLVAHCGIAEG